MDGPTSSSSAAIQWDPPDEKWLRNLRVRIGQSLAPQVAEAKKALALKLANTDDDDIVTRAGLNAEFEDVMDNFRKRAQDELDTHVQGELLQRRYVADQKLTPEEMAQLKRYQQTLYDHVAKGSPDHERTRTSSNEPRQGTRVSAVPMARASSGGSTTSVSASRDTSVFATIRPYAAEAPEPSRRRNNSVASTSSLEQQLWSPGRKQSDSNSGSYPTILVAGAISIPDAANERDRWTPLTPPDDPIARTSRSASSTLMGAGSTSRQSAVRAASRDSGWQAGTSPGNEPKRQSSRTWTTAVNDDGFTHIIPGTTPTSELEEGFVDAAHVEVENVSEIKRGKRSSRTNKTRAAPGSPSMIGPSLLVPPHASPSQSVTLLEARGTPTGSPNAFNIIDLSAPTQPLPSRTPAYTSTSQSMGRKGSASMARRAGRPGDLGLVDMFSSAVSPPLLDMGPPPATSIESLMAGNLETPGLNLPAGSNNTSTSSALASSRPKDGKHTIPTAPSSVQQRPLSIESNQGEALGILPSGTSPPTKAAFESRRTLPVSSSPRSNGTWSKQDGPNQHVPGVKPRRSSGSSFQQPEEPPSSNNARFRRGSASSMNGPSSIDDSSSSGPRNMPILRPRRSANMRDDHDGVGVSPRTRQWFGPEPIPEDSKLELPAQAEPSPRDRDGVGINMSRNGSLRARGSRDYLRNGPDSYGFNSVGQRRAGPLDDEFSDDESLLERRTMSVRSVDFEEIMKRDAEATRREEELKLKLREAEAREAEMEAAKVEFNLREEAFKQKETEVRILEEEATQHVAEARRHEAEVVRKEEETRKELEIARQEKEEARRGEEEARAREAAARKECEEARALEADAKRTAQEARKASDAAKRKEEQIKRKEEATRKKEEELKRKEEEARLQIKRAEEDAQRQVEAALREAQRREDELRRREEDLARREEDLVRREQLQRKEKELFEREQQLRSREEQQRPTRRQKADGIRQDHSPQSEGNELDEQHIDVHGSRKSPSTPLATPVSHDFDESLIDDEPLLAPPPALVYPGAPSIFEALLDPVTPVDRVRPESPLADDERSPHYRSRGTTKTRKRDEKQDRRTREERRRLQEEEEERMRLEEEEERRRLAEEEEHRDFHDASPPPDQAYHAQWQHGHVDPDEEEDALAARLRLEEEMQYQHVLEQEAQMQRDEEHRRQEEAARRRQLDEQAKDDERYAQQLYEEEQRHRRSEVERQRKQQHQDAIKRAQEEEAVRSEQFRRTQDADRMRRDAPMERDRRDEQARPQDDPRWREDRYRQDSAPVYPAAPSMSSNQPTSFTNAVPIPGHRSTSSSSQWSGGGNPSAAWSSSTKAPSASTRPSYPATGVSPGTASQRPMASSAQPTGPVPFASSAPRNAPLSEADWARLQAEQAKKQAEQFKREQERLAYEKQSMSAKAHTKESLAYHFQQHQLQWERIRTANKAGFNTFPWPLLHMPTGPDSFTVDTVGRYVLSDQYPADASKSNKDRVKENIRRWHPDRFDTQFLPKVNEDEREKVKECADAVVRALSELLARVNAPVFFDD